MLVLRLYMGSRRVKMIANGVHTVFTPKEVDYWSKFFKKGDTIEVYPGRVKSVSTLQNKTYYKPTARGTVLGLDRRGLYAEVVLAGSSKTVGVWLVPGEDRFNVVPEQGVVGLTSLTKQN